MFIGIATAIAFVMTLTVIELSLFAYRNIRYPDRGRIGKRLATLAAEGYKGVSPDILKKRTLSEIPLVNMLLSGIAGMESLEKLRRQANAGYPLGFYILVSVLLSFSVFLAAGFYFPDKIPFAVLGMLTGVLPFLYLRIRKNRRMERFMVQLPEALDLVARAMRAGHAFTSGLKMAADQFDDPLGPEFYETLDEINFGISVQDALKSLTSRLDCPDLRFFVVSVILQRETGGNLAEIIENIAQLIRERFKFHGKVRALSAEGKLSAYILVALPFFMFFLLSFLNPKYVQTLITEPSGRTALYIAGGMMFTGIVMLRRLMNFRV